MDTFPHLPLFRLVLIAGEHGGHGTLSAGEQIGMPPGLSPVAPMIGEQKPGEHVPEVDRLGEQVSGEHVPEVD